MRVARRRQARTWGVIALAVVAGGILLFFATRPKPEVEGVEKLANQGRGHVDTGTPVSYDSDAPTSGDHYGDSSTPCGSYTETPDMGALVHSLEHGAVVLWYRPDVGDEVQSSLEDIMDRYDSHVIVAPNAAIKEPVVATAWNRRLRFTDPDDPKLAEFVETYRRRAPEDVDCPI